MQYTSPIRLRKNLVVQPSLPQFPGGVQLAAFDATRHARAAHELLELAYRPGGGNVEPFDQWWPKVAGDPEYDPATVFTAVDMAGRVVGIALCWSVPFVKDLAVAPVWRGQGVGEALLLQAFSFFHHRGESHVELKVHEDNHAALRLYRRLGMQVVA